MANKRPLLHTEDVRRYKTKGLEVNRETVVDLLKTAKSYPGVKTVGMRHFALSSVASVPKVVEEIPIIRGAGENGG